MSFLLDPPLLLASGAAIERLAPDEPTAALLEKATIITFLGISIGLYFNLPGLGFLWKPFRSRNGRDFMLNSGVFHIESSPVSSVRTHLVAAAIYATYPGFLRLGRVLGRRASGSAAAPRSHGGHDRSVATAPAA